MDAAKVLISLNKNVLPKMSDHFQFIVFLLASVMQNTLQKLIWLLVIWNLGEGKYQSNFLHQEYDFKSELMILEA